MLDGNFKRGDLVQMKYLDGTFTGVYRILRRLYDNEAPGELCGVWYQLQKVACPSVTIYQADGNLFPANPIEVLDTLYEVGVSP